MMMKKDVGPCSPSTDRKVLKIKQPLNQRCQRSFHILYFIRCSTPSLLFRMSLPTPSQSPELIFQFRGGPKRGDAAIQPRQPSTVHIYTQLRLPCLYHSMCFTLDRYLYTKYSSYSSLLSLSLCGLCPYVLWCDVRPSEEEDEELGQACTSQVADE